MDDRITLWNLVFLVFVSIPAAILWFRTARRSPGRHAVTLPSSPTATPGPSRSSAVTTGRMEIRQMNDHRDPQGGTAPCREHDATASVRALASSGRRRAATYRAAGRRHTRFARSTLALGLVAVLTAAACGGSSTDELEPADASKRFEDPLAGEQWGLAATNVPEAWEVATGEGVVIAIVDSGVDLDHPDLVANLVPGWDFVDDDDEPDDPNGHGTHVAGIAAAATNDIGIAGVAPDASIMPVRVLDEEGRGSDETIAAAVVWAADHGADVINLSLGESGFISRFTKGGILNQAIRDVTAQGVVVVAASGNEGTRGQQYRIGVDVLVVNAIGPDSQLTSFSNVGDVRAISAPGAAIVSTAPPAPTAIWPDGTNGYAPLDGTSMAAPLVSGVAALAISAGIDRNQVIEVLASTAAVPDDATRAIGAGIVDAAAAVRS